MEGERGVSEKLVRHFRQILLWPLQVMAIRPGVQIQKHWEFLEQMGQDSPWMKITGKFPDDPTRFKEQQYSQFVTFLPHVQRFLYGEGMGTNAGGGSGESPMRVFRRTDVAGVRVTGALSKFRHQHFLAFLISHSHKAALSMLSDCFVAALNELDIQDTESIKKFKRTIHQLHEIFLRFTHRYWFHEVSDQLPVEDLFRMTAGHLGTDRLYSEVREELHDMSHYPESDTLRRQANMVIRLTVVTVFGIIGTLATGFLGMNLIDETKATLTDKLVYFLVATVLWGTFVVYTIMKSKRLSDFLEASSDVRLPFKAKFRAVLSVKKKRRAR